MRKQTEEKEIKKEEVERTFNLEEAFVLWKNKAKSGEDYLKGKTALDKKEDFIELVGYFNSRKKNPKEPDIRIYSLDSEGHQEKEVCSLWENISKNEKRYLTGATDDQEKIVAFYNDKEVEKRPYIRAYYRQD